MGIEITAPGPISLTTLNRALTRLRQPRLRAEAPTALLAPERAALWPLVQ